MLSTCCIITAIAWVAMILLEFSKRTVVVAASKEVEHALLTYYTRNGEWPVVGKCNSRGDVSWRVRVMPYMCKDVDDTLFMDNLAIAAFESYNSESRWDCKDNLRAVDNWKAHSKSSVVKMMRSMQLYLLRGSDCCENKRDIEELTVVIIELPRGNVDAWGNPGDVIIKLTEKEAILSDGRAILASEVYRFSVLPP